MNKKISSMGLLSVLAAVCLVVGIFTAINRAGFHSVYLNDTKSNHNGWKYEIRTDSGEVKKAVPQYTGEYDYTLSDESYNAVRRSRIMTETLANASLELDCVQCGVEMFLDDHLLYSDFQTVERDAYGYLLMEGIDIQNEWRCVAVSLPEDYSGKKLIIITYFPQDTEYRYALDPHLQSTDTVVSAAIAETVMPILWLVFCGCMVLGVAVCCMVPMPDRILRFKMALLFLVYVVSFIMYAYQSVMGYYSGLQGRIDRIFAEIPVDIDRAGLILLAVCAALLLVMEIWTERKKQQAGLSWRIIVFLIVGFVITSLQNSSELDGGGWSYFPTILLSIAAKHFVPIVKLCSSLIIYTITFLVMAQFIRWRVREWKRNSRLLERSRFIKENYELAMQAEEDSRRRNHEMRHHIETLHSLLMSEETEKAAEYIEKTMEDVERSAKLTYSGNIVVNSIVGIRLNQAKEKGITVRCHIHVPEKLEVENVDLSILLSNMLENATEACMRMEDGKEAYINLEIRKNQKFLFIECENSVDIKEALQDGQATVKADRKNHGFGLDAMRAVAEKYASIIQIEREPGRFTVRTNLCLTE